ncbi:hypothetical protein B0H14DRAFT_2623618 [Mycena olivaceomarginata]|nr:hypothetical protein B0H14DRAFT_2623618 [Mycena olivaceomarginata]
MLAPPRREGLRVPKKRQPIPKKKRKAPDPPGFVDEATRKKIRAEALLADSNPTEPETQSQKKEGTGGRSRIELLDRLVITSQELNANGSVSAAVYCIACDHRTSGREKNRIHSHAVAKDSNAGVLGGNILSVSSMTADNLVDCVKLYDYHTYDYTDNSPTFSRPHVFAHVPKAPETPAGTSAVRSAPTLMDLLHATTIDPEPLATTTDLEALEELNPSDPYDLAEAERCAADVPAVVRTNDGFDIAEYLVEGHGTVAGTGEAMVVDNAEDEGGAGWKVSDFLGGGGASDDDDDEDAGLIEDGLGSTTLGQRFV